MSKKQPKISLDGRHTNRRQFLIGAGSTFLTLPPLISLMAREAAAQVVATKKIRSVLYVGSLGIDPHQWHATNPTDLASFVNFSGALHTRYKKLNTFSAPISRVIDSSFTSMFPHMNVMQGLSLTGGYYQGHNHTVLGGSHSGDRTPIYGKSIDVLMEQSSNVYKPGDSVAHKAMRIGDADYSYDIISGKDVRSGTALGDRALFNKIFGALPTTVTTGPTQTSVNKKLIVDKVYADLKALEKNPRLSSEDKDLLGRYIAGVYDLQVKVDGGSPAPTCTKPTMALHATTSGNFYQFPQDPAWGVTNVNTVFENYIAMIRLAFMCDLTRVVYVGNTLWQDSPLARTHDGGLHHECPSSEAAADRQQWGIKQMLKLAQLLQTTTDPFGSGTLLDNSSILCTNELGSWTAAHSTFSMPAIMFGSAGGFFKTGNYVDYTQLPTVKTFGTIASPGRPYKQLLQSIMQSMGVPKSEYMLHGDGRGFGEFKEGINQFGKVTTNTFSAYTNEHNDLLPVVT